MDMERINKFETGAEKAETKEVIFNFPEIANLKEGMVSLVKKLQENIDAEKYGVLVSDDVGGRIPTLILRRIIKDRNPKAKIDTYFIASGKSYFPEYGSKNYKKLVDYIEDLTKKNSNALLVTQYMHSGGTAAKLAQALKDAHVDHIDVAAMESLGASLARDTYISSADNIYTGDFYGPHIKFDERSNKLTGVAKTKEYDPRPHLLSEVIAREGRGVFLSQEEFENLFGIQKRDTFKEIDIKMKNPGNAEGYEARIKEPLSEEELKELRDTINKAREDVETLANEVVKTVWP